MTANKRFQKLINKLGFRLIPVIGKPYIKSVSFRNHHLFTVPSEMRYEPHKEHSDPILKMRYPTYYECERKALIFNFRIKNRGYVQEAEQLLKET